MVGLALLAGCCPYRGRCRLESSASRFPDPDSHTHPSRKYPNGVETPLPDEPTWTELPVVSVNVRREGTDRHLIIQTATPTDGWKVRVKALRGASEKEAQFQIVGLAPASASMTPHETNPSERTIYREIQLGPAVEQVVVRGSEGSMLMDLE